MLEKEGGEVEEAWIMTVGEIGKENRRVTFLDRILDTI